MLIRFISKKNYDYDESRNDDFPRKIKKKCHFCYSDDKRWLQKAGFEIYRM